MSNLRYPVDRFLFIVILLLLLDILFCADRAGHTNPVDPAYKGEYGINPMVSGDSIMYAFSPVSVTITQGRDKYKSFRIFSDPPGVVDVNYSLIHQSDSLIEVYFVKQFEGRVGIIGIRPNGIKDTAFVFLIIKNPFIIRSPTVALWGDTVRCMIDTLPGGSRAWSGVKKVIWYNDGIIADSLEKDKMFNFIMKNKFTTTVSAVCVDIEGNALLLDSVVISGPGKKASFDSVYIMPLPLIVCKPVNLNVTIGSFVGDSGTLTVWFGEESVVEPVVFTDSSQKNVVVTFSKGFSDTGTYRIRLLYNNAYTTAVCGPLNINVGVVVPVVRFAHSADTMYVVVGQKVLLDLIGKADKYVLRIGEEKPDTVSTPYYERVFFTDSIAPVKIIVYGIDSLGYSGPSDTIILSARRFPYYISFVSFPDRKIMREVDSAVWKVRVFSIENKPVTAGKVLWYITNVSGDTVFVKETSPKDSLKTELSLFRPSIILWAVYIDSLGQKSQIISDFRLVIGVYPAIDSISNPSLIFNGTETSLNIFPRRAETNSPIVVYYWSFDGDTLWDDSTSEATNSITFQAPGTYTIVVQCKDSMGFSSQVISKSITVCDGAPVIDSIKVSSLIYDRCPVNLTAYAHEIKPDVRITTYYWSFDGDTVWEDSTFSATISRIFNSPGSYNILIQCKDSLGFRSTVVSKNIIVVDGAPVVDSITQVDTIVFVKKQFRLKIHARSVSNTRIDTFIVLMFRGNDTISTVNIFDVFKLATTDTSSAGTWMLSARCRDTLGRWSAFSSPFLLNIHKGIPAIERFTLPDIIWYNDSLPYTIAWNDSDGTVRKVKINWGDGCSDSLSVNAERDSVAVYHRYRITTPPTVSIKITDDYGLQSDINLEIPLRIGRPVIKPETKLLLREYYGYIDTLKFMIIGDTLFCPAIENFTYLFIDFYVDAFDTNGTVIRKTAYLPNPSADDRTIIDTLDISDDSIISIAAYYMGPYSPDSPAVMITLSCIDDDSLEGRSNFWLRTVGPPTPVTDISISAYHDTLSDSEVYISWIGGFDWRDPFSAVSVTIRLFGNYNVSEGYQDSIVWTGPLSDCVGGSEFRRLITIPSTYKSGPYNYFEIKTKNSFGLSSRGVSEYFYYKP